MTGRVPLDVLLRGPAAVAEWMADKAKSDKAKADEFQTRYIAVLGACGITQENMLAVDAQTYAMALCATTMAAVMMAYSAKHGMRGPARDALSAIVDDCFNLVDDMEASSPVLAEMIKRLREGIDG